ncbi:MAG: NAD-dependent epimerase/dehydratase family protein [Candidatus Atribacteria bacterium]|nr:NAD-dependent epimerase/dehydratase family protein [Candidatus Atribacteria bacterium]
MITIGITGQSGFIGTHLYNFLGLKKDEVTRIPFRDEFFSDHEKLKEFVKQCDVIVHLAAMNRHNDPQAIYDTNIRLVRQLLQALDDTGSKPHILFASSTQEERDNLYGKSKLEGRKMLTEWANKNQTLFTGFIIPNVFGPFGNPYYNSVVATFCHQLTHNEEPKIEIDGQLKLIYVGELVQEIWKAIHYQFSLAECRINHTSEIKVTDILGKLSAYKEQYFDNGMFPELNDRFDTNLFNTFRCYIDIGNHYPVRLKLNTDDRGTFVETIKTQLGGQISFSTTKPGITRGNHFHTRKIERFAVIKGKARIQLRRIGTSEVLNFDLDGNEPSYVDMPIWYTHNITNTGNEELYTIFWINEFFNPDDQDTYYEEV